MRNLASAFRHFSASILATAGLLLATGCAPVGQHAPKPVSPEEEIARIDAASRRLQEELMPYQRAGNLFGEVLQLRSMEGDLTTAGAMVRSMYLQQAATVESFIGNVPEALDLYGRQRAPGKAKAIDPAPLAGYQQRNAVEAIVHAAAGTRAVFVNEAHHVPQHRVLTRMLLPLLRQQGFTHFAAETLSHCEGEAEMSTYPTASTGYYTTEPLYADLVRAAIDLGYEIVAYESIDGRIPAEREPDQARNLAERIFGDPDARALVHLGYVHNSESPDSFGGVGAMASHFKAMTGIDPLTVDQTRMSERGNSLQEHPLYRHVADELKIDEATVFADASGSFWSPEGDSRDMTVFLPRTRIEAGRPHWLRLGSARRELTMPADVCGAAKHCLVEARLSEEGADAIPVDRVEVSPDQAAAVLLVPARELSIRAVDGQLEVLGSWSYSPSTGLHTKP